MYQIIQLISGLVGLVVLACAIIILIQLGKAKGPVHVILGILSCCIYPLIWGWQNADALDAANPPVAGLKYKQIVQIWTGLWVLNIILNAVARALL